MFLMTPVTLFIIPSLASLLLYNHFPESKAAKFVITQDMVFVDAINVNN